jgi:hypothetical protein
MVAMSRVRAVRARLAVLVLLVLLAFPLGGCLVTGVTLMLLAEEPVLADPQGNAPNPRVDGVRSEVRCR